MSSGAVAALDPGRNKCGLVLSDPARQRIVAAAVASPEHTEELLERWLADGLVALVLGNGTGSGPWRQRLDSRLAVELVDERGTTLAARQRYWQLEPPRGWRRLLPKGLLLPPRDFDDVVAQLLLERWLGHPLQRSCGQPAQKLARTVNE